MLGQGMHQDWEEPNWLRRQHTMLAATPCTIWLDRATPRTGSRSTAQLMARLRRAKVLLHREALVSHAAAQTLNCILATLGTLASR